MHQRRRVLSYNKREREEIENCKFYCSATSARCSIACSLIVCCTCTIGWWWCNVKWKRICCIVMWKGWRLQLILMICSISQLSPFREQQQQITSAMRIKLWDWARGALFVKKERKQEWTATKKMNQILSVAIGPKQQLLSFVGWKQTKAAKKEILSFLFLLNNSFPFYWLSKIRSLSKWVLLVVGRRGGFLLLNVELLFFGVICTIGKNETLFFFAY